MYIAYICVFLLIFPCYHCSENNVYLVEKVEKGNITEYNVHCPRESIMSGETVKFNVTDHAITQGTCRLVNRSHVAVQLQKDLKNPNYNYYEFDTILPGNWTCSLYSGNRRKESVAIFLVVEQTSVSWYTSEKTVISLSSTCIILLIITLALVGFIVYVMCRARTPRGIESLSAMQLHPNDRARYTKAPLKRPLIAESPNRDSVIYEALDPIQLQASREDPPLQKVTCTPIPMTKLNDPPTLPKTEVSSEVETKRKEKVKKETSKTEGGVTLRRFFGISKSKQKVGEKDKRTTSERIKERPPLPLPEDPVADEEYEEMEPFQPARKPVPTKNNLKNIPNNPPMPVINQNLVKKPVPPPPTQVKPVKPALSPKTETVNELENVLKKKGLGAAKPPVSPNRPVHQNIPPMPKPSNAPPMATARPKGTMPKPTFPIPPGKPKNSIPTSPVKPTPSTFPKPSVQKPPQPKPPVITRPVKSAPMDAPEPPPISTLPRPAKPPPVEEEDDYNGWGEEEWTYEPLREYNIYSV